MLPFLRRLDQYVANRYIADILRCQFYVADILRRQFGDLNWS